MQFFTIRSGPYVSQVGNMDPSVLNELSTKCECEFSIRYGDIFSESVPTVKQGLLRVQFSILRRGPYVSQVGNMDPSVLNELSTKCECEFSIRYGDIFSESVPTVKHAVHSALYILVAGASPRFSNPSWGGPWPEP